PRMEIGSGRQRKLLALTVPIYPEKRPPSTVRFARHVDQVGAGGNIEVDDPGIPAHRHTLQDREWLTGHSESVGVEGNRQEIPVSPVNQMARGRIARVRAAFD